MRTLKLTIQYDGTNYVGWQRQPSGVSIQGLIEDALRADRRRRRDGARRGPDRCRRARPRTGCEREPGDFAGRGNARPRAERRAARRRPHHRRSRRCAPNFHARFSASPKTYEYRIVNAPFVAAFLLRYVVAHPAAARFRTRCAPRRRRSSAATISRRFRARDRSSSRPSGRSWRIDVGGRRRFDQPLGHPRHGGRLPAPHGPEHRRHAGRGGARAGGLRAGCWTILASRSRAQAGRTAPARGLFLVREVTDVTEAQALSATLLATSFILRRWLACIIDV